MIYDSLDGLLRVFVMSLGAYAGLILLLRLSGKRTLAKLNAFDLVVTVALGSTLATIILTSDVALLEGLAAFVALIALQFVVAALQTRWRRVRRLAKSSARTLLVDGIADPEALREERLTHDELMSAARSAGFGDPADIAAIVLEPDGSLSVVALKRAGNRSALPADARATR